MFGKCWSIPMLVLLLFYSTGDAWRLIWYQLDRDSFAEYFCENIDQPQLDCRGSCQLPKLGQQNEDRASGGEAPVLPVTLRLPGPFLHPVSPSAFPFLFENTGPAERPAFLFSYAHHYSWAPFRPPAFQ